MTIETKKMIGVMGSALAAMSALAGMVLMGMQIKTQGTGFFVAYVLYALAILAGGMFVTWIPSAKNHKWGFKKVDGKLKWTKYTNVVDEKRTRLIWWPIITLFFELFGIFSFCNELWPSPKYEALTNVFCMLTVAFLLVWALSTAKRNEPKV